MHYAQTSQKSSIILLPRILTRISIVTSAAIGLLAAPAAAQTIGYTSGSYTPACGTVGWVLPGPTTPSLGGAYSTGYSFVFINGQWIYAPAPTYTIPTGSGCPTVGSTGGTGPTGGSPNSELFVQGGGGAGDDGTGNPDNPGWTGGGDPNYPGPNLDTPINTLTVTPEPSTILMLGSGLVGLGVAVRRRRRKN